ncbi:MAG: HD domain-containing protein [Turicibacter sp.]|nr:HD domain-containing protein [Turicibacter sp.]
MKMAEKVFKDPIHGYISVDDRLIWELIQSKEFQRLRRITQLGGTVMAFHGAQHCRFSHSLGVYLVAKRMIERLIKAGAEFSEEERVLTLCAALLHDLGHGPFSHSFEEVLEVSHEVFTARILTEDTQVNRILENFQPGFSQQVKSVIMKAHPNKVVVKIVSSQLDADRLDYLVRDAYYTGTPYGEIDVQRILRTLRVKEGELVFKVSGMHAIEDYLLSRYQMYWQVYLHPVARSFDIIVQGLLKRIRALLQTDYPFKQDMSLFKGLFLEGVPHISVYLKMDDATIYYMAQCLCDEEDAILQDFADRLLNRRLLKEYYYQPDARLQEVLYMIKQNMVKLGFDPDYYYWPDYQFKVPYDYYGPESLGDGIKLLMRDGSVEEITEVSNILSGIVGKPKKDYKLYIPIDAIRNHPDCEEKTAILNLLKSLNRG